MSLPEMGIVSYFRANEKIPGAADSNKLFALARTAPDKFLLVAGGGVQKNINYMSAKDLASKATFVRKELVETVVKRKGNQRGLKQEKGLLEALLFEAESAIQPSETDPVVVEDVSLDQKVDRYIVRYEKEAIPTSKDYSTDMAVQGKVNAGERAPGVATGVPVSMEGKKIKGDKKGLLETLLFEAPGDPMGGLGAAPPPAAPPGGGEDPMGAPPPDSPSPGEEAPEASPPVVDTPKMNMNSFCRAVARLVENYEALLNPKTTILNRAKEYVRVNYDEATARMFEQVMENQFDISGDSPSDQRDQRDAPHAVGAIYGTPGG